MTDLSPAAQAVLDAYRSNWVDEPLRIDVECLAAALRAAAARLRQGDLLLRLIANAPVMEGADG